MRGWKVGASALMLWVSSFANSFDFNSSYYGIYETGVVANGCNYVYIVPKSSFLIIGIEQPTPIMFMPQTTGFRALSCPDGSLSSFTKIALTANDMAVQGATSSARYKLFGGDFDGDGKADFFVQGKGGVLNSVVLTADASGTPRIYSNLYAALNSDVYTQVVVLDVDQNGRSDIVATDTWGNVNTHMIDSSGGSNSTGGLGANTTMLVGSINGKFRVDESGNSTYSVDILTATGTAGVVPHVSVNYSSGAGDGVMGTGWSIGGLSAITRCRQTLAQDNNTTAITLGASDRFCLDGQRLIVTAGTYGAPGSTYRTEIDSYAVITANGGSTGNPAYFTVVRKDGSTSYYGNGNGSQLVLNGNGPVLNWAISRFQDSVGNPIRFSYFNDASTNEQLINRIDYGYGSNIGATNDSTTYLSFNYESRLDASSGYVAGSKVQRTKRLKSIYSYNNGNEIRRYTPAYRTTDPVHYQSYVQQLFECVGNSCLSPTTFKWDLNNGGLFSPVSVFSVASAEAMPSYLSDFNGDGRSDIIYIAHQGSSYKVYYRFGAPNGFGPEAYLTNARGFEANLGLGDFNNDGRGDLLFGRTDENWSLYPGGAGGLGTAIPQGLPYKKNAQFIDFNQDALLEAAYPKNENMEWQFNPIVRTNIGGSWTYQFGPAQVMSIDERPGDFGISTKPIVVDFNGDGRMDFLGDNLPCQDDYCFPVTGAVVSKGDGTFALTMPLPGYVDKDHLKVSDINGDGLPDVLGKFGDSWKLFINTGNAFEQIFNFGGINNGVLAQFIDLGNDQCPDLVYPSNGYLRVRYCNPISFSYGAEINTGFAIVDKDKESYKFNDVDADGHVDLLRTVHTNNSDTVYIYRSLDAGKVGNKITSIDNGFGSATSITYKPLTDSSAYTKGNDANDANKWPGAPVFDIVAPSQVVASVSSTAPRAHDTTPAAVNYSALSSVSYKYAGLKMQASGRGSLGFASITTTDNQTGVKTVTTYNQKFPFIGQPLTTTVTSGAGITIKSSTNTQNKIERVGVDGTKYYQIYTPTVSETINDPTSSARLSYVLTETVAPDEWGNIWGTQSSPGIVVTTYGYGLAVAKKMSTYNEYGSTDYDKQFARLSKTVVTHSRPSQNNIIRTSLFTYYGSGDGSLRGLLKTEQVATPDGSTSLLKTYQYDQFGNKRCVSVGSDANAATNCTPSTNNRYEIANYDTAGRYAIDKRSPFKTGTTWVDVITEQVVARNAIGLPTQVNSLNGVVTHFSYDALGRELSRGDNTGAAVTTTYARYGVAGAQYNVTTSSNVGAVSTQYFDALGRGIAKWQRGFDGRWSISETEYDNIGRVKRQSVPHYSGDAVHWATNNYDAFRLRRQITPATNGASSQISMGYSVYGGEFSLTTTTNALGQTRKEYRNPAGELIWSEDVNESYIEYTYDAAGQLIQTATYGAQNGSSMVINTYLEYDQLGRKIKMRDSAKGTWFYEYNEFGDLSAQYKVMSTSNYAGTLEQAWADPAMSIEYTTMSYDKRGRMIGRTDVAKSIYGAYVNTNIWQWIYDTAANGIGQLKQERRTIGGVFSRTYSYDTLGRPISTMHSDGNGSYLLSVEYDSIGRPYKNTDALGTGSGTINNYNDYGYVESVADIATNTTLYSVQGMDARGNVTSAIYGNGATANWLYDQGSGSLINQTTTSVLGVTLQRLDYSWDLLGNQISRWDRGYDKTTSGSPVYKNLQQSFCYDNLNRLIKSHQNTLSGSCSLAPTQQDQQYDDFGNITSKSNVGTYTYSSTSPNQLQSTSDGVSYTYDSVGNLISDSSSRTLTYTVFDKVSSVSKGGNQITYDYGADRNYFKRTDTSSAGTTTTYYIGNVEKVVKPDGSYDMKRNLAGVALFNHHFNSAGAQTGVDKQYIYKDALDSVVLITDHVGTVKQQLAYNSWGERVNTNDWQTVLPSTMFLPVSQQFTTQSYTGQEAMDAVGLVNYGGRIYDPRIARFVQADPFVQDGEDLQAYNRYAYVRNNPLTLTDPSGYFSLNPFKHAKKIKKLLDEPVHKLMRAVGPGVSGVVVGFASGFCGPAYAACAAGGSYEIAKAHGASESDALLSGAVAGASAYAFNQVGSKFNQTPAQAFATKSFQDAALYSTKAIVTHGLVGGVMSELSGGNFGDGFIGAGLAKGLSLTSVIEGRDWYHVAGRIAIAAAAGGTISEATGGKFGNGAISAAFSQAFNGERHLFDEYIPNDRLNTAARSVLQNRELQADGAIVVYPPETYLLTPTRQGNGLIYYDPTVNFDPLNDNANTIRIMFQSKDSRTPAPYIRYFNENGQAISPYSGRTGSNAETHYPLKGMKLNNSP